VLEIDPETSTVKQIGDELEGEAKYGCIAAGASGKLYAAQLNASKVLEIDPETSTVKQIGDELEGDNKYNCIAAGANGKLYAAPYDAGKVLEIDPETSNVKQIRDALEVEENTNVLLQAPTKNALQHHQAQQKSWRSTPQSFLF
jgi:streptogramin lyase